MLRREYDTKRADDLFFSITFSAHPSQHNGTEQLQQQQNSCIDHVLWKQEHKEALTAVEQKASLEMPSHEKSVKGHSQEVTCFVSLHTSVSFPTPGSNLRSPALPSRMIPKPSFTSGLCTHLN